MPHELRKLERSARIQAALAGEPRAKRVLLEIAEEYCRRADWKEANTYGSRSQGLGIDMINRDGRELAAHGPQTDCPVPLSSDPSGEFEETTPEAVQFTIFSGNDRIVCRVERSALHDRAMADGTDTRDLVATFARHRQIIEQIAREEYQAGVEMPVVRAKHLAPGT